MIVCGSTRTLLLLLLPLADRGGLALLISACGLFWLLWGLATAPSPRPLGALNGWLLVYLALALLATGCSPVPAAAAKGLFKLVSYLGVYALMRRLLETAPRWWDRLLAALLLVGTLFFVVGTLGAIQVPCVAWTPLKSMEQIGPLGVFGMFQLLELCELLRRHKGLQKDSKEFLELRR